MSALALFTSVFLDLPAGAQTPPDKAGSASAPASFPTPTAEARLAGLSEAEKTIKKQGKARIIVQFDPSQALAAMAASGLDETARREAAIRTTRASIMANLAGTGYDAVKTFERLPLVAMEVEADALDVLANDPSVVGIQIDHMVNLYLAESIGVIDADALHDQGDVGAGKAVAILDTGVDSAHPFFGGRVVSEACFSTSSPPRTESSCPGGLPRAEGPGSAAPCAGNGCDHGTHVAGIAAGSANTLRGVAPDAGVVAIQVFSVQLNGSCGGIPAPCPTAFLSDIQLGLDHVLVLSDDLDIAAANLSLGFGRFTSHCDTDFFQFKLAIDALRAVGVTTVIATGNNGFDGAIGSPACVSSAIAVGSTTKTDQISFFSNHAAIVDLLAPGSRITSSLPGGVFGVLDGTSMATPHVAGAVALLAGAEPDATIADIERALLNTGRSLARAGISKPRIDVDDALAELRGAEPLPVPANDLFADALALDETAGSSRGTNVDATSEPGEPAHAGVGGGASVWWNWRPPFSGEATITTAGSDFDTVLAVYTGPAVDRLVEVVSNDDATGPGLQSSVSFQAEGGQTYRIAVDGFAGAVGDITLSHTLLDTSLAGTDRFRDAPRLPGRSGSAIGSTVGATAEPGEPAHAGVAGDKSIWWRWRAPASGLVTFSTAGSDFDTVLAVYRGGRVNRLREVQSNDDTGSLQSEVTFRARRNKTYRIAVDGFAGAEGGVVLSYGPPGQTTMTLAGQ